MRSLLGWACVAAVALAPAAAWAGNGSTPDPWSGFYAGVQAGAAKVDAREGYVASPGATSDEIGGEGSSAGLFAGYNFLLGGRWLAGAEVEADAASLDGQLQNVGNGGPYYSHDWFAAGRLRLGYLPSPGTLVYASVGVAAGHFDYSQGYWGLYAPPNNLADTLAGLQLAAGIESFVAPGLGLRMETAYTQYGTGVIYGDEWRFTPDTLIARAGLAYHLDGTGRRAPDASPRAVARSWSGGYVGAAAGATIFDSVEDNLIDTTGNPQFDYSATAPEGGVYAGVNWQMGNFVAGVEADGTLTDARIIGNAVDYGRQNWLAALRGRLGLVGLDDVLFYGTAGLAVSGFDYSQSYTSGGAFTAHGLQIGAGAETFLTSSLSARVEGLYTAYDGHQVESGATPVAILNPHTLEGRVGLSWHLN